MLNGVGEFQKILVIGGKSDIALSIVGTLPISADAEIILCGRHMSDLILSPNLDHFNIERVEVDFTNIFDAQNIIESIFHIGDVVIVILAYSILSNNESQLDSHLFANVLNTNFYSQAIILNHVYAKMVSQKHGQILYISSVAGLRPRKVNFVYGISKFGVDLISQGLQKMSVGTNVFITILRPGFVHTKMTAGLPPAPFAITQMSLAKIAVKGLKKRRKVIYAPRKLRMIMLILKLLPERIFRILDK